MGLSEFFAMGGYAIYVWPSYALTLLLLVLNWYLPYQQHKKTLQQLKRRKRRTEVKK